MSLHTVTVGQLIETLMRYDLNTPLQVLGTDIEWASEEASQDACDPVLFEDGNWLVLAPDNYQTERWQESREYWFKRLTNGQPPAKLVKIGS